MLMLTVSTGAMPANQPPSVATEQACTSIAKTSSKAITDDCGERSCDKSHDLRESHDKSYSTPPQTPVDKDSVLVSHNLQCMLIFS